MAPPNLSAPSTAAANVPLGPVLVWQAEDNASSYQFQLATTDTFNPVVRSNYYRDNICPQRFAAQSKLFLACKQSILVVKVPLVLPTVLKLQVSTVRSTLLMDFLLQLMTPLV